VGLLAQEPVVVVRVRPWRGVPVTAGGVVFVGAAELRASALEAKSPVAAALARAAAITATKPMPVRVFMMFSPSRTRVTRLLFPLAGPPDRFERRAYSMLTRSLRA
jgi:hypothetical protein